MDLIGRMFEHDEEEYLGLTGMPPEKAIYLSMFHASGLHRNEAGRWGFYPPPQDDPCHWQPVWNDLHVFLKQAGSVTIGDVLKFLNDPPYGLRQGLATLLVATFLRYYRHNLVLFEKGSYQVRVTRDHFMRLAKNPGNFSVHYVPSRTGKAALIEAYIENLDIFKKTLEPGAELADMAGQIYKWFLHLPAYVLNTRRISGTAKSVRNILKKAIDPVDLLYEALPRACGEEQGFPPGTVDPEQAQTFLGRLNVALVELGDAPKRLHTELTDILLDVFRFGGCLAELRGSLRDNYLPLADELSDYKLKSFLIRAGNADLSDKKWLESIASLFTGKSLSNWQDNTVECFKVEAKGIAGRLKRWAALLLARGGRGDRPDGLIGIHIVNAAGTEHAFTVERNGRLPSRLETLRNQVRALLAHETSASWVLAHLLAETLENDETNETTNEVQDGSNQKARSPHP